MDCERKRPVTSTEPLPRDKLLLGLGIDEWVISVLASFLEDVEREKARPALDSARKALGDALVRLPFTGWKPLAMGIEVGRAVTPLAYKRGGECGVALATTAGTYTLSLPCDDGLLEEALLVLSSHPLLVFMEEAGLEHAYGRVAVEDYLTPSLPEERFTYVLRGPIHLLARRAAAKGVAIMFNGEWIVARHDGLLEILLEAKKMGIPLDTVEGYAIDNETGEKYRLKITTLPHGRYRVSLTPMRGEKRRWAEA